MPYIDGLWIGENSITDENTADFEEVIKAGRKKGVPGWASQSGGFRFQCMDMVESKLPVGMYRFFKSDQGRFFQRQPFQSDNVISLPDLPSDYILDQMKTFWSKEAEYKKHRLIHKRGILLYGAPGCGKTSIVKLLSNEVMKLNGVVFTINDYEDAATFISEFRTAEPNRFILTIQEDIERFFDGSAGPEQLKAALSFLDGESQVNNIVHLATTNEPEKLADRFTKRPGRFDLIVGVHAPTRNARTAYLKHVDPTLSDDIVKELVEKTDGLSLAYMRELISTYVCLGIPLDDTIKRLQIDSKKKLLKNKTCEDKFGFTINYGE